MTADGGAAADRLQPAGVDRCPATGLPAVGAQRFPAANLRGLAVALLARAGAPEAEARLVADHLVDADLAGHGSHGVQRLPQYLEMVRQGTVRLGAPLTILAEQGQLVRASGNWNFGPVTAAAAVRLAIARAQDGVAAAVTVRDCNHVSSLGPVAALAAAERMIGIIAANGHGGDLAVAPSGGRGRRLATNPLCVAVPTARPWPVVVDLATSAVSGGQLRLWRDQGQPAPPDVLLDARGAATRDVAAYYGPPAGALRPLGAPEQAHKGFGLAMLLDVLAGALSGAGCSRAAAERSGNALLVAVLRVEAFQPWPRFAAQIEALIERLHACPPAVPGGPPVCLPGEHAYRQRQQRLREGIPVSAAVRQRLCRLAAEFEVTMPAPMPG